MSFILDALRKSEAERQRQDAPGFVHVPSTSQQKPAGKWIWLVATLITVNLAVLAFVMLRPDSTMTPTITNPPDNTAGATPAAIAITSQPVTVAPAREQAVNTDPFIAVPAQQAVTNLPLAAEPVFSSAAEPTPPLSASAATFNNLRAQGQLNLPDMHLDIHVYSGQPADRFVFINMSKYKERATLAEGPLVKEITPEGVILEYQGVNFLLPRE